MKNNIRIVLLSIVLSLNFIIYKNHNINSYALEEKSKLDLLISNKQKQDELELKLNILDENLESKRKEINNELNEKEVEVISISFVENKKTISEVSKTSVLSQEIMSIENQRKELSGQLESYMIEGVMLEKSIEEEKQEYLQINNLDYISGLWPVPSYTEISSPFGKRVHPITNKEDFHKGIDIPAPEYTGIISSDDGIVIFSGIQNGYGNVVKIKHFDGKITVYAHNTVNLVEDGDIVRCGETIAKIGSTGNSTGNHVHFETIVNEENINPIYVVNK